MQEKRLRTAILGADASSETLIESLRQSPLYEIVAYAHPDAETAKKTAARLECQPYDDYRQGVIQSEPEVVFTTGPLHQGADHILTAMKNRAHVIKSLPPGLDFEQTAQFIKAARKNGVRFLTLNYARFYESYQRLLDTIAQGPKDSFIMVSLEFFNCRNLDSLADRWLTDPQLAGGGVLLRDTWHMLDELVRGFDLPQHVYALHTNQAPDRQQRLSTTEDSSLVTMKFSDTLIATLIATRSYGPEGSVIKVYQKDRSIHVTPNEFAIYSPQAERIEHQSCPNAAQMAFAKMIETYARHLQDSQNVPLGFDETSDLKTAALIEAAYLSGRTAMPEEPARMLSLGHVELKSI